VHLDGQWLPEENLLRPNGKLLVEFKHSTVDQLLRHNLLTRDEVASLLVTTTIRNPFDYWVSDWVRHRRWAPLLDDPTSWVHGQAAAQRRIRAAVELDFLGYTRRFLGGQRKPRHLSGRFVRHARYVMRFERLDEDFAALLRVLELPPVELMRTNVSPERDRDYRSYYNPATRRLVARAFGPDLRVFGYRF
jgi:hypothetical protein